MLKASVLVVSRTPELLNRLLLSLDQAYSGSQETIEIIASWNGSVADECLIASGRLPFIIAQHDPYHFARNMNSLARKARGQVLIFANDDLIADPGSMDAALERLESRSDVGIVGARLRTSEGQLAHAGIHFTVNGSPYHQLEHFVDASHPTNGRERLVPAITGAFFAMRRNEFLQLELAETFKVCGEDVLLCLQTRSILRKQILYCPAMSGVHDAGSTRDHLNGQRGTIDDDMKRMQDGWREMLQTADREGLILELQAAQDESEDLRECCHQRQDSIASLQQELARVESQSEKAAALQAKLTKSQLQISLLENETKRLLSRVQQLENQFMHPAEPRQ